MSRMAAVMAVVSQAVLIAKSREGNRPRPVLLPVRPALRAGIDAFRARGEPLPAVSECQLGGRRSDRRDDPLWLLGWSHLSGQCGFAEIADHVKLPLRSALLDVVAEVGLAGPWGRDADFIAHAAKGDQIRWTPALTSHQLPAMVGNVLTACLVVTAALSGMRSSELLELDVGCRRVSRSGSRGQRFRLTGRLIKGQGLGGRPDEWEVSATVDRALALAERLTGRLPGDPVFPGVGLSEQVKTLRSWLSRTGLGTYWGLAEIPAGT